MKHYNILLFVKQWYNVGMNFENPFENKKINIDLLLEEMYNRDQGVRLKKEGYENLNMEDIDKRNIDELKNIINKVGWEKIFNNLERLNRTWLLIQHADFDINFQEFFLEKLKNNQKDLIEKFSDKKDIIKNHIVMLDDRILTNKYGYQKYGSQWRKNQEDIYELVPILKENIKDIDWKQIRNNSNIIETYDLFKLSDIQDLNKKRAEMGMKSIQEYARSNKEWKKSIYPWIKDNNFE